MLKNNSHLSLPIILSLARLSVSPFCCDRSRRAALTLFHSVGFLSPNVCLCIWIIVLAAPRAPLAQLSALIIAIDERHKPDTLQSPSTTTNFPAYAFVASFTSPLRSEFIFESRRRAYATETRNVLFFSSQFSAGCLLAKSRNVRARLVIIYFSVVSIGARGFGSRRFM